MITSYALVRVKPSKDKQVYMAVKEFSEVKEVVMTYGSFDLIIRIITESLEDLDHFIFHRLRTLEGVVVTTTLIQARQKEPTK